MNILFIMDRRVNRGSIQAVASYVRAGDELDYKVALYGQPDPNYPGVRCSTDLGAFDHLVFICEFGLQWISGLRLLKILSESEREQRAVLDADGMYNPVVSVDDYDRNHTNEWERLQWTGRCDQLADRVMQPSLEPLETTVLPVPFYGYDPSLQIEREASPPKRYDIMHMGHNWWRWTEVSTRLLPALERIRSHVGGVCFMGMWWDMVPAGAHEQNLEIAFGCDVERFERSRIEIRPPVPYTEVISAMSESKINIMTQRPLFRRLKILTSKFFEIFCADTIPLVALDPDHAELVYGSSGRELTLNAQLPEKLLDVLGHPARYREIVQEVRDHLAAHHCYRVRLQELVSALETKGIADERVSA